MHRRCLLDQRLPDGGVLPGGLLPDSWVSFVAAAGLVVPPSAAPPVFPPDPSGMPGVPLGAPLEATFFDRSITSPLVPPPAVTSPGKCVCLMPVSEDEASRLSAHPAI